MFNVQLCSICSIMYDTILLKNDDKYEIFFQQNSFIYFYHISKKKNRTKKSFMQIEPTQDDTYFMHGRRARIL